MVHGGPDTYREQGDVAIVATGDPANADACEMKPCCLEESVGEEATARRALAVPAKLRGSPAGTKASTVRDTSAQAHTMIQDASFMILDWVPPAWCWICSRMLAD